MGERTAAEEARTRGESATADATGGEGVRVTDRRRISLDDSEEGVRVQEAADAPSLKPKYVEELEARTRAAEGVAKDVQARFEQVRAELKRETDEVRQRLARTADERAAREKAAFVGALLPVMENLRRAMEAAEGGGSLDALLEGLRGTLSGFESALASGGIEAITAVGELFDPELHEAVDVCEVEPARDGLVTAEYSRGYRMNGQLLRPARVQVGRARGEGQATTE
ncbi:MAG TPA: nucleotide exchange factor GrpE [Pyrinomonadaceae bacterium]|jgi:molecular chaperone GrpE